MEKSKLPPSFLNIAKPSGLTAHDVVNRVRRITGIKQVGHAGTLDPAATGVLPIAVGKACRLLRFLTSDKVYLAEFLLGTVTDTDDLEGQVISTSQQLPTAQLVQAELGKFIGQIEQLPPLYSAVHHKGERLYNLARKGEKPEGIALRTVTIHQLEVLDIALPVVRTRIACSSGTYIRSIARDLGEALQCGGCLKSLVRESAGPFHLSQSITLEQLQLLSQQGKWNEALVGPLEILNLEQIELDELQRASLLKGQSLADFPGSVPEESSDHQFILATHAGSLLAVCRKNAQGQIQPEVVIASPE